MKGLEIKQDSLKEYEENTIIALMKCKGIEINKLILGNNGGLILGAPECEEVVEFFYVLEGNLVVQGEKEIVLQKGDFLYNFDLEKEVLVTAKGVCTLLCLSNSDVKKGVETHLEKMNKRLDEIQQKDHYTSKHCRRVAFYANKLAGCIGNVDLQNIMNASYAHDIGKCKIPDEVLLKPGRFTKEEREIMNKHSLYTYQLLKDTFEYNEEVCQIALYHHERYDGTGYPKGLKGNEIPIGAQIIAIVDTFDAMTTTRPYQKARTPEVALEQMITFKHEYNPDIFEVFRELVESGELGPSTLPLDHLDD